MSLQVFAVTTTLGRQALAQQLVNGLPAIQIVGFSIGEGGHDPGDPMTSIPPDPTLTALVSQTFPPSGYEIYDSVEWPNPFGPVFVCRLELSEGIGQVSELGLWAKYVSGPNINNVFLYAVTSFPLRGKTAFDAFAFRVALPF